MIGLRSSGISCCLMLMLLVGSPIITVFGQQKPYPTILPHGLFPPDVATRIRADPATIAAASTDFGRITRVVPAAVFFPSSDRDIAALVRFAYGESPRRLAVAPRGNGHSVWGQASARDGIVLDMRSLSSSGAATDGDEGGALPVSGAPRISVSGAGGYVDAGGEQLWVEVLNETLKRGVAPRSWTDYLYLTVGGTLSNAGVSGQAFRYGPQISNVYELDVVTGKGEMMTCSRELNQDLFYAVLGGLGQFGVITRARIALEPAPQRVKWVRLSYTDFTAFTKDQEYLISLDRGGEPAGEKNVNKKKGFDYVEGFVYLDSISKSGSSFFSEAESGRIRSLAAQHGLVYSLEGSMYYGPASASTVEQDLELLLKDLRFIPGSASTKDVSYASFLNRVHDEELGLRKKGQWDVPHPWLNVFVPKSRIFDFDEGVFKGILKQSHAMGPIIIYPHNKEKWDERMSSVTPDEDVFYSVSLLWSSTTGGWAQVENQNAQVLRFCDQAGIKAKQYLPHYNTTSDWVKHFGSKWGTFLERKRKYDPKALLSPGQGIFSSQFV